MTDRLTLSFDHSSLSEIPLVEAAIGKIRTIPVPVLRPDVRALALRGWSDRAVAEYSGTLAMRHLHGLLVDLNAPIDLQTLALVMLAQEQHHTRLCLAATRSLGGDGTLTFDVADLQHVRSAAPLSDQLATVVVQLFYLGEAVALALLRHTLRATPASAFRDIHRRIAPDEALHAAVGPLFLRELRREGWCAWPGDEAVRAVFFAARARMAERDVVEADEGAAFEDPEAAAQLVSVGIPPSNPLRSAYHRVLGRLERRFEGAVGSG